MIMIMHGWRRIGAPLHKSLWFLFIGTTKTIFFLTKLSPTMEVSKGSNNWFQQLSLNKSALSMNNNCKKSDPSEAKMNSAKSGVAQEVRVKSRRAAVLVCLFEGDRGDLRVILTQRCSRISYPGEVSLPGGKVDEGDSNDSETALREAKEEIGLDPSLVKIVTVLDPYMTKRLMSVTPVIGILSDKQAFKPVPNSDEVETIFDVPLDMFLKNENQRSEEREWMGDKYLLHFFDYETTGNKKFVIWGLTSWILIQVASMVYQRAPNFVQQIPNYKIRSLLAEETNK